MNAVTDVFVNGVALRPGVDYTVDPLGQLILAKAIEPNDYFMAQGMTDGAPWRQGSNVHPSGRASNVLKLTGMCKEKAPV